jgi:hypothetical protein
MCLPFKVSHFNLAQGRTKRWGDGRCRAAAYPKIEIKNTDFVKRITQNALRGLPLNPSQLLRSTDEHYIRSLEK